MSLKTLDSIYIVCSGNTCRSPLAARILQGELEKRGIDTIDIQSRRAAIAEKKTSEGKSGVRWDDDVGSFSASSANSFGSYGSYGGGGYGSYGTSSRQAEPMSQGTAAVIRRVFADEQYVSQHHARDMGLEELSSADLVITMSRSHTRTLRSRVEAFTDGKKTKVYTFGDLLGKPALEVPDPFGSDELLLDNVYRGENALSENKSGFGPMPPSKVSVPKGYFTPEREEELRFQAYKPVYDLLSKIFEHLLSLENLPSLSMEDCLRSEVDSSYAEWRRSQEDTSKKSPLVTKISAWINPPQKPLSAFEAYEKGDYPMALKLMQEEQSTVAKGWYEFDVLCSEVSTFKPGRDFNSPAARVHDKLHHVVIPSLIQGGYTTSRFTLDHAAIEQDLQLVVDGVTSQLFPLMRKLGRDGAFEVRKLTHALISAVETTYPKDCIADFYQHLGGN